jgi:hypothetical protein
LILDISISENEHAAIRKYADMCGESVHNLIRKILIQEIAFLKNDIRKIPSQYEYHVLVPIDISDEEKFITSNYNKIRKILGIKEMK